MPTTNITLDDTSSAIVYSSNWATQASNGNDSNISQFFMDTYHSSQTNGTTANITFNGSAIYVFGTRGPEHANYSIQFDEYVIIYSAITGAETSTHYQQPLFAYTFPEDGPHFVQLQTIQVSDGHWLDLDFITITINNTESIPTASISSAPTVSQTIDPPWLEESDLESGDTSSSNTGSPSKATFILAIVFGIICGVFVIASVLALLRRKCGRRFRGGGNMRTGFMKNIFGKSDHGPASTAAPMFGSLEAPENWKHSNVSVLKYNEATPRTEQPYDAVGETDPFSRDNLISPHSEIRMDGRQTPTSLTSLGASTMLTVTSTTQLLKPTLQKDEGSRAYLSAIKEIQLEKYVDNKDLGVSKRKPRPSKATHLPIYAERRTVESMYSSSSTTVPMYTQKPQNLPPYSSKRPLPLPPTTSNTKPARPSYTVANSDDSSLPPLHASHRQETTPVRYDKKLPTRPPRPEKGLLDWLGGGIGQTIERATGLDSASRKRREDANSQRTDFLKV